MPRRYYWWIIARDSDGRPYLIFGSDQSEDAARQRGLEMLPMSDFEIRRYPTRSKSEASAFYRGKRLEDGEGLDKARQRIGHEKSIDRLKRRIARQQGEW